MLVGSPLLHLPSPAIGEPFTLPSSGVGRAAVVYLGVFATALAFLICDTLLDAVGPLEMSLVAYLVPVVATIAGVAVLQKWITLLTIAGFLVVVLGFGLLKHREIAVFVCDAACGRRDDAWSNL